MFFSTPHTLLQMVEPLKQSEEKNCGGDSRSVRDELRGVKHICSANKVGMTCLYELCL